jgi:radical SAM superfamily enzyme YgiQ (UPF0313 family)
MSENKIIFVSSGMLTNKKEHQHKQLYINYGFLNLASIVNKEKHNVQVYQGENYSPQEMLDIIVKNSPLSVELPIFLSIPSYYAVEWAKSFIIQVKKKNENFKIIIGGRWVLSDKEWSLKVFNNVDIIVHGQAEDIIINLLDKVNSYFQEKYIDNSKSKNKTPLSSLDYNLLYDFKRYSPSIELARGCGFGCDFCADKDVPLSQMKEPHILIKEIINILESYSSEKLNFYFESSIFKPTESWASSFYDLYIKNNLNILWRSETRADVQLSDKILNTLASSGLKILDVGLESASHQQLKNMEKTTKPKSYLEKASKLLEKCYEYGIWVKINIMLYPGETIETISETMNFLDEHKKYIKGISAYPMVAYGTDYHASYFLKHIEKFGANAIDNKIDDSGITVLNLSKEITNHKAKDIAIQICKKYMSRKDYYDLKSFNYFPIDYSYSDFSKNISLINKNKLPFD